MSSEPEDVSVLRDVLDELDRERSQRAELEAKVRALESRNRGAKRTPSQEASLVSHKELIALRTEKEGLVELLEALLGDEPPFSSAPKSLPLHAVRLLEIMPWDPRARQHAVGSEELYEWQFFVREGWARHLRQFPQAFRALPVIQPMQEPDTARKGLFGESPPKQVVLTDASLSNVVNVDNGYPLPDDDEATWEWVSGWRVDRHGKDNEGRPIDCDDQGWSYARTPHDFEKRELCWDLATNDKGSVIRRYRRRKWTRRRVLVSYPNASQRSLEYLRLLGENMRLGVSVTKLSDQLVETKTALTETEAKLLETKAESRAELERLRTKLKQTEELFNELELGITGDDEAQDSSLLDNLRKEKAEKIHSLLRTSSWNGSTAEDSTTERNNGSEQKFHWKRPGSFIEHIKKSPSLLHGRMAPRDDNKVKRDESPSHSTSRQDQLVMPVLRPNDSVADRDRKVLLSLQESQADMDATG